MCNRKINKAKISSLRRTDTIYKCLAEKVEKKKYEKTVQILDIRSKKEDKTVDTM